MYSLRDLIKQDWERALRDVARIGFKAVQVSAMGQCPTADLARLMSELKLHCIGEHVGLNLLQDSLADVIHRGRALNARWIFLPSLPQSLKTPEGYRLVADFLNGLSATLRRVGLKAGYHNHAFEFEPLPGGGCGYDVLMERCSHDVVMEVDTFWVQRGGLDPAALMRRLTGRLEVLHIKDMNREDPAKFAEIGAGTLAWPAIFAAADAVGTRWMVIEQDDCYGRNPLESMEQSLSFCRKAGFAD